jgi:hypothetical protein
VIIVASVSRASTASASRRVPGVRPLRSGRPFNRHARSAAGGDAVRAQRHEPGPRQVPRARRLAHDLPAYEELAVRIDFFGDEVERIVELDPLTGEILAEREKIDIYPGEALRHLQRAGAGDREDIERSCRAARVLRRRQGKILEAARLEERTRYDIETLRETGYCSGHRELLAPPRSARAGSTPWTLLDYFPDDWLLFIDESHIALPQVRGMFFGDRSRKETLVEYGFRLPSALDNRPLNFEEFDRAHQPGRLRLRDARDPTRSSVSSRWSSRSSARPGLSTRRSR